MQIIRARKGARHTGGGVLQVLFALLVAGIIALLAQRKLTRKNLLSSQVSLNTQYTAVLVREAGGTGHPGDPPLCWNCADAG